MNKESLTVFTPAVRMLVLVAAYQEDGTFENHICPVVGVECRLERISGGKTPAGRPAPDKLFGDYHPLIVSDICGGNMITTQDDVGESINVATELVACPWPPAEDCSRLAGVLRRVQDRAREKALSSPEWTCGRATG